MAQFLSEMKPFELSSSELLMLCNHCPASPVELHLLIEESEERLDEQQVFCNCYLHVPRRSDTQMANPLLIRRILFQVYFLHLT